MRGTKRQAGCSVRESLRGESVTSRPVPSTPYRGEIEDEADKPGQGLWLLGPARFAADLDGVLVHQGPGRAGEAERAAADRAGDG